MELNNDTPVAKRTRTVKSAMDLDFANLRHILAEEGHAYCDWLTWIGSPMLYDGALFVTREQILHSEIV